MKKILFGLVFLVISIALVSAQEIGKIEIGDRDVKWSDFIGTADESSKFDAYTYWVASYFFPSAKFENGSAFVTAKVSLFLRSDSWVKSNKKSVRLLKHEQGHFRIGRICAREIETTINTTAFSTDNYHREIDAIYWKIIRKYKEIDKLYDQETDHYKNQAEQSRWNKKLDDLLNQ